MRAAPRVPNAGAASKAVLAGLMALLLLVASTLSVSHALHRSLHHDGTVNGHVCLACSLAKGYANGPEVSVVPTLAAFSLLFWACSYQGLVLPISSGVRLPHGRAPPTP